MIQPAWFCHSLYFADWILIWLWLGYWLLTWLWLGYWSDYGLVIDYGLIIDLIMASGHWLWLDHCWLWLDYWSDHGLVLVCHQLRLYALDNGGYGAREVDGYNNLTSSGLSDQIFLTGNEYKGTTYKLDTVWKHWSLVCSCHSKEGCIIYACNKQRFR